MMRTGLIGRKLGMTQVFGEGGAAVSVTVVEMEPSVVIQKKSTDHDLYDAIQLGYGRVKQKKVSKSLQGHFQKANKGFFRYLREFRVAPGEFEMGQELSVDLFHAGDFVDVVGTTKGKGFAGGVKRHGFRGGRATHGSMFHRAPGSIGASADPSRVLKGKKLPGHMGGERKTVQNLMVWAVRPDKNLMLIKGAVPGAKNGVVLVTPARKKAAS